MSLGLKIANVDSTSRSPGTNGISSQPEEKPRNARRYTKQEQETRTQQRDKNKLRVGTLNVITLTGNTEEIVDMMERTKIHNLGLSETKWKGKKLLKLLRGEYKLFWQDHNKEAKNEVGFVFHKDIDPVTDVSFVSERIIRARVNLGKTSFTILQVYAPQQGCSEEEKTKFLEELEDQVREDNIMIIGDLNAQIGTDRNGYEGVTGPFGYG
ncbi:craniofacial development protein 2-like [Schistocerca nitens]|uniref:craniofacial development protein 2-like n=1 Tax=Schistocerca nitens TaxID=7011 RepID=UPI002117C73A|nr:craniofacial development protein 2-like [Schistocerca nitens]